VRLLRDVKELQPLVTPRQRIVAGDRQTAEQNAVLRAEGREIRAVLRIGQVALACCCSEEVR
jgi:hypothetical protein